MTERKSKAPAVKQTIYKVTETTELMKFLLEKMPDKSRTTVKSFLIHRQVSVNDKIVSQYNHLLKPGYEVVINNTRIMNEAEYKGLKIVYEDASLLVIDKNSGLLSIATDREKETTAYSILSDHLKKEKKKTFIFIVHRLDRDTSGLMMFAKSKHIQYVMQEAWQNAVVEREYAAVVEGDVEHEEGTIRSYFSEGPMYNMISSQNPNEGQLAITHFKRLRHNKDCSLLKFNLETGRKNQIRVHAKDIGHCIVGDKKYGATTNPISRLGLHAMSLKFTHPVTGKLMSFETNIPQKFLRLFDKIPQ